MENTRRPSFGFAFGTFLLVMAIIVLGMLVFKLDTHSLLITSILVAGIAAVRLGYTYDNVIDFMVYGISKSLSALFIFIMIGAVVGSWITAGTVPTLIVYGLKLIGPKIFLPAGLILCSIMSVACGTSWGTVGTLGVALIGIGSSLGIPLPIVAGMVISGACFGDKMSPISDTTNLAPVSAGADIFDHIRAMMLTTIPTFIICLIIYTFIGFKYAGNAIDVENISLITNTLNSEFTINLIVLLPIVVTLVLSFMRFPALLAMTVGVITGIVVAVFVQGVPFADVLSAINYGYSNDTGVAMVDKLLNRGGIQGMMWTFSFAVIILALGGILDKTGILAAMVERLTQVVKRPASLVASTIGSAGLACMATGDSYPAIILTGNVYQGAFDKSGMSRSMLSRCCEEGATLLIPLVPWSGTAAFMGGALGVSAIQYMPYTFLCWLNPIVSIVLAYLGHCIVWKKNVPNEMAKETQTLEG